MRAYFDTSALIMLVVAEPGRALAADVWDAADAALASRLAYPEGRAALAAGERQGRIGASAHRSARRSFDTLFREVVVVEVTQALATRAGELAEQQALRGYEAVHLASALAAADGDLVLVTWDEDLARAALRVGLTVSPPPGSLS